jgi:ankyrin repeat protein
MDYFSLLSEETQEYIRNTERVKARAYYLQRFCINDDLEGVKLLIKEGIDLNLRDEWWVEGLELPEEIYMRHKVNTMVCTPLRYAILAKKEELVTLLKEHGAKE